MLACSGLEHAHRGFESFARECFEELRDEPRLDIELVKATAPDGYEPAEWRRMARLARLGYPARIAGSIWAELRHVR